MTKFENIKLFKNAQKLKLKNHTWEAIILNRELLFELLFHLLLDKTNLFYYATQMTSTKTINESKEFIKKLIDNDIIGDSLNDIFSSIGWEDIDISNSRFQGDLGEYLMTILIDTYLDCKTIISKVSLKTSPKVSSFGNDNIFYDFEKNILFYGEAKFYNSVKDALNSATSSLKLHNESELKFITTHSNFIIGEEREELIEKLELRKYGEFTIKSIVFIINDDIHLKEDYDKILNDKSNKDSNFDNILKNDIIVFLPILSKEEFLEYFKKEIESIE
ncbi:MAG: Hachiman antiphage defense system protein HamA [bacterium]